MVSDGQTTLYAALSIPAILFIADPPQAEVRDMMYTFGDARDTNDEAAELIECLVRAYTADILRKSHANAARRGARMTMDDVIFQIRRDTPKLNRLKEYLSWREIRKGLKTQTEKPTDDPSAAVDVKGTARTESLNRVQYLRVAFFFCASCATVQRSFTTVVDAQQQRPRRHRIRLPWDNLAALKPRASMHSPAASA